MALSLSAVCSSPTIRTITAFATGNTVAMLLNVVGSLVQARCVGPEDMGVFRTFGIVAGYLTFLHMGVLDGLYRELPLQLGRASQAAAERAASACLAWIAFISVACGTVFVALALRAAYYRDWMRFWGWLAYSPFIVATFYGNYLGMTFRTGQQFITLSKAGVIQAVVGVLVLPLLPLMGYFGVCLRAAANSATTLVLLHRWRPMKLRPRLDWHGLWAVIRIGLPLSGIGYIYTSLWISLEGTLVLAWFGIDALGLYSIAVIVRTVIAQLVQNVSQVLTVKICERYGRSSGAGDALRRIVTPVVLASLVSVPPIAVGWLLLPSMVKLLIPRYVEATFLIQLFLITMPVTMLAIPTAILWIAVRLADCLISVVAALAAFIATAYCLHRMGFGPPGVAVAYLVGQVVYLLAAWTFTLRLISRERGDSLRLDEGVLAGNAADRGTPIVEQG